MVSHHSVTLSQNDTGPPKNPTPLKTNPHTHTLNSLSSKSATYSLP
jgi:hypothetical protein